MEIAIARRRRGHMQFASAISREDQLDMAIEEALDARSFLNGVTAESNARPK
jgi:hypothetical protein